MKWIKAGTVGLLGWTTVLLVVSEPASHENWLRVWIVSKELAVILGCICYLLWKRWQKDIEALDI